MSLTWTPGDSSPAKKRLVLKWEPIAGGGWSSAAGYVRREHDGQWCAYLQRNRGSSAAWTERRAGFSTPERARRWVEIESEAYSQ